jgi:hypothetical protein
MSIKLFFDISREYFDLIYSQNLEYDNDSETFDEEKGFEEWVENKNKELCYSSLCLIILQIFKSQIRQKSE